MMTKTCMLLNGLRVKFILINLPGFNFKTLLLNDKKQLQSLRRKPVIRTEYLSRFFACFRQQYSCTAMAAADWQITSPGIAFPYCGAYNGYGAGVFSF